MDVSAIGMGTWNIGGQWGEIDEGTAHATIRAALDNGVNLFDAAESYGFPYGTSEKRLGRSLAGDRHRAVIVTKIGNWGKREGVPVPKESPHLLRLCAHACLHRLRTDWIDVLLCHEGNLEDPTVYLEAFQMLKEEGCIRHFGVSTDNLDLLKAFNQNGDCAVVQVNYSLLQREPEKEFLPYCKENNIAVMVRGPVAMGLLSGRYDQNHRFTDSVRRHWHTDEKKQASLKTKLENVERLKAQVSPGPEMIQTALRYVISHPSQPVAIPGAKSPSQAIANAAAGNREFTPGECRQWRQIMDP